MPLRMVLILVGLFATCIAVVLLAWSAGSQFYVFVPGRRVLPPPTHPMVVLVFLAVCLALFRYSQHYGLVALSLLLGGLVLGSIIGPWVFAWRPTVPQILLTLAMLGEVAYGWSINNFYLDD